MERFTYTPVPQELSSDVIDNYIFDDPELIEDLHDFVKRAETLAELKAMYGARIFHYGGRSGTVADMEDMCPVFGEKLEQGVQVASAWLEAHDESQIVDETENIIEETQQVTDELELRAEEDSTSLNENAPLTPEIVVSLERTESRSDQRVVSEADKSDKDTTSDTKSISEKVLETVTVKDQSNIAETSPEVASTQQVGIESGGESISLINVTPAAMVALKSESSKDTVSGIGDGGVAVKAESEKAVTQPLIQERLDEAKAEVIEPSIKVEPEMIEKTDTAANAVVESQPRGEHPDLPPNPSANIPRLYGLDMPAHNKSEESSEDEMENVEPDIVISSEDKFEVINDGIENDIGLNEDIVDEEYHWWPVREYETKLEPPEFDSVLDLSDSEVLDEAIGYGVSISDSDINNEPLMETSALEQEESDFDPSKLSEHSDTSEDNGNYHEPILTLVNDADHVEAPLEQDAGAEVVYVDDTIQDGNDKVTVLRNMLENERADAETLPVEGNEVADMLSEIIGVPPEVAYEYVPMNVYRQEDDVYEKIDLLEQARTAMECHDALRAIREELAGMLALLGYANAVEIAEQLTKQYDTKTLRKFIAALMRALTAVEASTVQRIQGAASAPSRHKCGSGVVSLVVSLGHSVRKPLAA